eukprot:2675553-Rhodomonas_salina.1
MSGTDIAYGPKRCPVLTQRMALSDVRVWSTTQSNARYYHSEWSRAPCDASVLTYQPTRSLVLPHRPMLCDARYGHTSHSTKRPP